MTCVSILSRPLGDVAVDEGQKLRITTPVKGNPVPTFTWTKDGKPIDPKRVHFFSDGELVSAHSFAFLDIPPNTSLDYTDHSFWKHFPLLELGRLFIRRTISSRT